jgi:hypothetical protein
MSTKCTVLYGKGYHFYFDYKDDKYHIDHQTKRDLQTFLNKAGKILEQCPFSDSGIYSIAMQPGVKSTVMKQTCKLCEKCERKTNAK